VFLNRSHLGAVDTIRYVILRVHCTTGNSVPGSNNIATELSHELGTSRTLLVRTPTFSSNATTV
jgi:hypothetical protein